MACVTITVASFYYKVSLQLMGIPAGTQAYSLVDGSLVPTDVWMEANPPVPKQQPFLVFGGPDILDDFSPPPIYVSPESPFAPPPFDHDYDHAGCIGYTGFTGPCHHAFFFTANVLGNDEMSVPGTTYQVTVMDYRSRENISQAVYSITGASYDLDTATPISTTPIADLNPPGSCPSSSW